MAINITKLLAAINTKVTAADSSQSIIELNRLAAAATLGNDVKHARIFTALTDLPTADSTNVGDIVRVGATLDSDTTKYYLSHNDKWKLITLQDSSTISQGSSGGGYSFQGSNFGYTSGGFTALNVIDKFPFAADANAADVGDLSVARYGTGQSSADNGYTSGGAPSSNVIDKFPFAADANATDVGDLTVARYYSAGQSSETNGYTSGGNPLTNVIDKFPFASDENATDVGDITTTTYGPVGQSSADNGYTSGGFPPYSNVIDKFPFASDANATDVGDLTLARRHPAGQSSTVSGYSSGGLPTTNVIDKFPFASDANATDVGDLTLARFGPAGQSSTVSGYSSGGDHPAAASPLGDNIIDKFPFASDANATDVGDLTSVRIFAAGQQY